MSSTYRVLCLSHDPAIVIDYDFDDAPAAEYAVRNRAGDPALGSHLGCDLLIGRYSYPLVGLACPGGKPDGHGGSYHVDLFWTDAKWLRLMSAAALSGDSMATEVAESISARGCWSWQRIHRLRFELGDAS